MDSRGNIFYTDLTHVHKISPDGCESIAVKNVHTHELFIDDDDNLYGEHVWYEGEATDKWGYYVWRLDHTGKFEKVVPPTVGFPINNTLVRDQSGNSYFAEKSNDHEVLNVQNKNGKVTKFNNHLFKDIRWIHYSKHDHHLYIVDHLRIKKVAPNGDLSVITQSLKENTPSFANVQDHHYVYSIWTDPNSNVYVAVYGAKKIKMIKPNKGMKTIYTSPEGWSPAGGLASSDGSLYVLEFSEKNQTRVRHITPENRTYIYQQ